ncbi:m7GpppX diphosphatase [Culicoides brevitarsis]|uniref:m7GpppX diphosphatase n=1 Tax=Culicoides brevitarsis TaxID=469753 RepID=UPI00307C3243
MSNDESDAPAAVSEPQSDYDLSQFRGERLLSNNTDRKTVCVLGKFPQLSQEDQAIVILEKNAFTEEQILTADREKNFFQFISTLNKEFINDIYGNFTLLAKPEANTIKTTIIYPATAKHISKYTNQNLFIIRETPELYETLTEPYLSKGQFSLDWVYNILEHKQEEERIVFEDPDNDNGFILLPDLKWDGKTKETLYLIAISRRRDIRTLRDLTASHLPLLKSIRDKSIATIREKYDIQESQLRIYVHYQPSFYHFHVHFTYLRHSAPGINCERSHLLDTVISNLELLSDYYKKSTLSFTVRETDTLYEKYEEIINERNCKKIRVE